MKSKPIFNKRLYKAQAGITISKGAGEILHRKPHVHVPRSQSDLHTLRSVVCGLKEIHKNFEFVKSALGHAITYERHDSDSRLEKSDNEKEMSCYYILSGSVEAFYKVKNVTPGKKEEYCIISYTHVAGDYIGLVSADGPRFDLPPPEYITTLEHSEFIRIDRQLFHDKIQDAQKQFRNEITHFLDNHKLFEKLTDEDRNKLILQLAKQEFPAGKQILTQGTKQEYAFFIAKGRCGFHRRIFLPEQRRSELFKMGYVEEGSYFDPSCILDDQESKFSVIAVGPVTCYLLNKWTIKNSESLLKALTANRPSFQTDKVIENLIKESDQWQSFKRDVVCNTLVLKDRSSMIVPKDQVSKTLKRAVRHGTALRRQRQQELYHYTQDELDPRYGKSPEHLKDQKETHQDSGKSVLKAIMLMRRSRGSSIQKDIKDKELQNITDSKTESDKDIANVWLRNRVKRPHSVPKLETKSRPDTENITRRYSTDKGSADVTKSKISPEAKNNGKLSSPGFPQVSEDCWVTNELKFVTKEVINTHIPGKAYHVSPAYQRFGRSMFESLDKLNGFEKEKAIDPFGAKIAAATWLKKARATLYADRNDYNPGRSPVIVISEFCKCDNDCEEDDDHRMGGGSPEKNELKTKESVGDCGKLYNYRSVKEARGQQRILDTLIEDNDKEDLDENTNKDEWRTAVHETKYESECCLEKAKRELAEIEQQLFRLGWSYDKLLAKEKKKREDMRKHSTKTNDSETEESHEEIREKEEMKENSVKTERKRTIKRQESISKILEDLSLRKQQRDSRSARKLMLTKRHSTSSLPAKRHFQERKLQMRTSTIS